MKPKEFCDEFHQVDLRLLENCLKVTHGCQHVYVIFLSSLHSVFRLLISSKLLI